jgi:ABC-type transport system involved in cytochrome bd biosynthesis fused ATPase/permease subunit
VETDNAPVTETLSREELLRRVDERLASIDRRLESLARERQHEEFSIARLIGVVVQVAAVGALVVSIAAWAFQAALGQQLVLLLFAGVLQLGALTAFVVAGTSR